MSQRHYFGTDGIRGAVGQDPITPDFMLRLGHAVGRVLRRQTKRPTVLIGKDTRISGYMIESALEAGFASAVVVERVVRCADHDAQVQPQRARQVGHARRRQRSRQQDVDAGRGLSLIHI